MGDVVGVERHHMCEKIGAVVIPLPLLPPVELEVLLEGELFLDRVVRTKEINNTTIIIISITNDRFTAE